ncbi:Hypothetical_protein [Hexamita inflata]|uniref:Hypothetical_protein n=1 Tax=Hexamita inflata TaxID=28002 RepID=A0AA86U625_9EUKA|nr:Hypothetical protein HINF_LOCUS28396 [Hexamita inflata]
MINLAFDLSRSLQLETKLMSLECYYFNCQLYTQIIFNISHSLLLSFIYTCIVYVSSACLHGQHTSCQRSGLIPSSRWKYPSNSVASQLSSFRFDFTYFPTGQGGLLYTSSMFQTSYRWVSSVYVKNFFQITAYILLILFWISIFPTASQLAA